MNLHIQYNLYQNFNCLFSPLVFGDEQVDPKIHMDVQGALNRQDDLEKEELTWKAHTS